MTQDSCEIDPPNHLVTYIKSIYLDYLIQDANEDIIININNDIDSGE